MTQGKQRKSSIGQSKEATLSFSLADIKELFSLMRENEIAELNIEQGGTRIHIIGSHAPASPSQPVPQVVPVMPSVAPMGLVPSGGTQVAMTRPSEIKSEAESASGAGGNEDKTTEEISAKVKTITSPMVGTFYRAPAPDAPPFVQVGDHVKEDTTLCIIEAMKLMNEIKAEMRGKVVKILVENGMPVEYNQPLFLIEPE